MKSIEKINRELEYKKSCEFLKLEVSFTQNGISKEGRNFFETSNLESEKENLKTSLGRKNETKKFILLAEKSLKQENKNRFSNALNKLLLKTTNGTAGFEFGSITLKNCDYRKIKNLKIKLAEIEHLTISQKNKISKEIV